MKSPEITGISRRQPARIFSSDKGKKIVSKDAGYSVDYKGSAWGCLKESKVMNSDLESSASLCHNKQAMCLSCHWMKYVCIPV